MKRISCLLVLGLLVQSAQAAPIVDGVKDAAYGNPRAVQTIETGFGDNASEWNAAYAIVDSGRLYLMLTGNLQDNFNKLEIWIDSVAGGSNVLPATPGNDGAGIMAGMTLDVAMTPEYHLIARRGFNGVDRFDLDIAELGTFNFDSYLNIGGGVNDGFSAVTGTGMVNASPIGVGFDNSNVAGIGGTAGAAANQAAAKAVTTGLELSIDLADIGSPTGSLRVMVLQNDGSHDFLSNQTLGGLPVGTINLGFPASFVDFSTLFPTTDQFFTVSIPEPATFVMAGLGVAALALRRRRRG